MSEAIMVALISGALSLIGVVISNLALAKKSEKERAVAQAVTDTKLDALTAEVREHNNFAQKMPAMQQMVSDLERRVSSLEQYHKAPIQN